MKKLMDRIRDNLAGAVVTVAGLALSTAFTLWLNVRDLKAEVNLHQQAVQTQAVQIDSLRERASADAQRVSELGGKIDILIEEMRHLRADIRESYKHR